MKEVRILEKGWIKVHRSITECFIWTDKPFDKARAWIDLLLLVCHKDKKIMIDGKPFTVARGSYLISRGKLAERWGWSLKKLDNYLRVLEREDMVTTFSTKKGIVITIVNYDKFQVKGTTEDTAEDTTQDTVEDIPEEIAEDTAEDRQKKELKNVKNEKKINNRGFVKPTVEDVRAYCTERNNNVDAESFVDFYESKGWMVGKNKMKDWKAAVRTWERSRNSNCNNNYPKPQQTTTSNDLDPQITAQLRALEEQQLASLPDVANMSDEDIDRLIRGEL